MSVEAVIISATYGELPTLSFSLATGLPFAISVELAEIIVDTCPQSALTLSPSLATPFPLVITLLDEVIIVPLILGPCIEQVPNVLSFSLASPLLIRYFLGLLNPHQN